VCRGAEGDDDNYYQLELRLRWHICRWSNVFICWLWLNVELGFQPWFLFPDLWRIHWWWARWRYRAMGCLIWH
jgi:hypothetical protein